MIWNVISEPIEKNKNLNTGINMSNQKRVKRGFGLTARQIAFAIIMLIILSISGIGYVWSSFECIQLGYDLSALKQKELRLKEENARLRLELATLKSPQYLEKAIKGMGFKVPEPKQIVFIE